jgi:hypothetical protein
METEDMTACRTGPQLGRLSSTYEQSVISNTDSYEIRFGYLHVVHQEKIRVYDLILIHQSISVCSSNGSTIDSISEKRTYQQLVGQRSRADNENWYRTKP